jgi:hypothetical protein
MGSRAHRQCGATAVAWRAHPYGPIGRELAGRLWRAAGHSGASGAGPGGAYRVGPPDREATVALLTRALGDGYLTATEFDQRVSSAIDARTGSELAGLTADLPPGWLAELRRRERFARCARLARLGVALHVAGYAAGMTLMVAIWLAVGATSGHWYPWPIWPALGWGVGVLGHAIPVLLATRPRHP